MKPTKRRKLENAGWRVGNAEDFLKLTVDEQKAVRLVLSDCERVNRSRNS